MDNNTQGGFYYPLFKYFSDAHNLTLVDGEIQDIIRQVEHFKKGVLADEEKEIEKTVQVFYFGTDNNTAGHYWHKDFNPKGFGIKKEIYNIEKVFGFHPEALPKGSKKGDVLNFNINDYSILKIEGSAVDERGGTQSTFWAKDVTVDQLKKIILSYPIVQEMIKKMRFHPVFD